MKKSIILLAIMVCTLTIFADAIDYVGYKELYENQKEYNSNIISTVITVFALACGLVITLQAVSWYTEYSRYNQFVDQIKKQVADELNQMRKEMKNNIDERIDAVVEGKISMLSNSVKHLRTEVGEIKDNTNHLEKRMERISENDS